MKRMTMDGIETLNPARKGTRLWIAGGWIALVPKVQADPQTMAAYTRYFEQTNAPLHARKLAEEAVQGVFEGGFIHKLRMTIQRRAQRYVRMYPALIEEAAPPYKTARKRYFTPIGFDPERIQATFIPGGNANEDDKTWIEGELREMGMEALAGVRV